ncbi:hypothetical protein [Marinobacter sp. F3R08]|uniref:hypothetical protein n=1 Tax=Marinobacter sp. F3R08 TaxID=2841559 RepID=UPI001C09786C|nr:hypothetical protein [Marinobacter sp. F3R08]MBU2952999.1 hypothetical protein [Marinobacter sp. F3R08]
MTTELNALEILTLQVPLLFLVMVVAAEGCTRFRIVSRVSSGCLGCGVPAMVKE